MTNFSNDRYHLADVVNSACLFVLEWGDRPDKPETNGVQSARLVRPTLNPFPSVGAFAERCWMGRIVREQGPVRFLPSAVATAVFEFAYRFCGSKAIADGVVVSSLADVISWSS